MGAAVNQPENTRIVLLEGDLILSQAPETRTLLLKALNEANEVFIQFENIGRMDLSFLQLFCAVHRSAVRMKKLIRFEGSIPDILRSSANVAGYSYLKGCKFDIENNCLWNAAERANHE